MCNITDLPLKFILVTYQIYIGNVNSFSRIFETETPQVMLPHHLEMKKGAPRRVYISQGALGPAEELPGALGRFSD